MFSVENTAFFLTKSYLLANILAILPVLQAVLMHYLLILQLFDAFFTCFATIRLILSFLCISCIVLLFATVAKQLIT